MKSFLFIFGLVTMSPLCCMDWGAMADSLLIHAAINNSLELAQIALKDHAYLNAQDTLGCTSVYHAALYGHSEMLEFLLQHGADPNIKDAFGNYPIGKAVEGNHLEAVNLLIEYDAYLYVKNAQGLTPLDLATLSDSTDVLMLLISTGLDLTSIDTTPTSAIEHYQKKNREVACAIIKLYSQALNAYGQASNSNSQRAQFALNALRSIVPSIATRLLSLLQHRLKKSSN
ncbi:ankyrin repeat domain-containing protein [Candidatus Dependentiae bacterium]|nr:ankyrin repeat domain-containing protein [Candidatus Dependentiae bacterium]